jgi:predicted alpha/beta hydrolase family esterase
MFRHAYNCIAPFIFHIITIMSASDPHAPFQAKMPVSQAIRTGNGNFATGSISPNMTLSMGSMQTAQDNISGLCEICFVECELRCSSCKAVKYCSPEHQQQHWKTHKHLCSQIKALRNADKKKYKDLMREMGKEARRLAPPLPAAVWSVGLTGSLKYEWLVNCYRMRVDDDCTHGGGKKHGLYLITGEDVASQSIEARTRIAIDFMLFAKLAVIKGVIPHQDWNWGSFVAAGGSLLGTPFTKDDAKRRYGSENVFDALNGGRSLRATGDAVYCTAVTNPKYSSDEDYVRIKAELMEAFPVTSPLAIGDNILRPIAPDGTRREVVQIMGTELVLSDIGGEVWAGLVSRISL